MSKLSKDEFAALVERFEVHDEELHRTGAVRSVESLEWDVTTAEVTPAVPANITSWRVGGDRASAWLPGDHTALDGNAAGGGIASP